MSKILEGILGIILLLSFYMSIVAVYLSFCANLFQSTFLPLLVLSIIVVIISKIFVRGIGTESKKVKRLNALYQKELADAKSSDQAEEIKFQQHRERETTVLRQDLYNLEKQLAQRQQELYAMDCLHDKDKHIEIVTRLIEYIDGRRADSIKEALNMYDAERAEIGKMQNKFYEEQTRRRIQSLKDDEEERHRWKMEALAREQVKLEKERNKQIEDFLNN